MYRAVGSTKSIPTSSVFVADQHSPTTTKPGTDEGNFESNESMDENVLPLRVVTSEPTRDLFSEFVQQSFNGSGGWALRVDFRNLNWAHH